MRWRDLAACLVLRPLFDHPLRTALAVLGIACGTALYVAISIINAATIDHFGESVTALAGGATVSVRGDDTGFAEETLEVVEKVPGVDRVVPVVQARARAGARGEQSVLVLGVDMLRESAVRAYQGDQDVLDDPLEFLNQADSVLTTRAFADEHRLAVGAPLVLSTASGPQTFVVRGILGAAGPAKAFGGRVVFMDIDAARVSFGKEGRTDRLDVVGRKGADDGVLVRDIGAAVAGQALRVERPSDQTVAFEKMIAAYQEVLTGLARLALVVAVFLVGNTMAVAVAERRKEIGVLRAIGATRGVVLTVFLVTASVLGLTGAILGLPLGRVLAAVLVHTVSRSVALTYATPIDVATLRLPLDIALVAVGSGMLASLVGGVVPAVAASKVPCVEALRPKDVDFAPAEATARLPRVIGAALLVYVGIASMLELDWRVPLLHGTTLTIAYFGGALVAPWVASTVLSVLGKAVARSPLVRLLPVKLAVASLAGSARSAAGSSSLIAALMLVLLMTTTHASFKGTLTDSTARMLTADVWVSENGLFLNGDSAPLREDIKAEIDRIPGIETTRSGGAHAQRTIKIQHAGRTVVLKAWDRAPSELTPIVMMDGGSKRGDAASIEALFDTARPTLLVSENFASHFGKRRGDTVTLDTPSGRVDFAVAGVMLEFASSEGTIYTSRETYKRLWNDPLVTMFYAFVAPGASPVEVRDRIDAAIGERRGVVASVTEQVRGLTEQVLDEAFAYTRAIEAAALLVGLFGLLGTMLVSILERKRELGMLRAVGATRSQIAAMIVTESALVGAAASLTALVLGAYLARVWLGGALTHDVGWPIAVRIPALAVIGTIATGMAVGMLVGIFGGQRAANVELRDALSHE